MPGNEKKKRKTISPLNVAIAAILTHINPDIAGSVDLNNHSGASTNAHLDQEDEEINSLTIDSSDSANNESDRTTFHSSHSSHASHVSHRSHYSGR